MNPFDETIITPIETNVNLCKIDFLFNTKISVCRAKLEYLR